MPSNPIRSSDAPFEESHATRFPLLGAEPLQPVSPLDGAAGGGGTWGVQAKVHPGSTFRLQRERGTTTALPSSRDIGAICWVPETIAASPVPDPPPE